MRLPPTFNLPLRFFSLVLALSVAFPVLAQGPGPLYPAPQLTPVRQNNLFNVPLNSTSAYFPPQWTDLNAMLQNDLVTGIAVIVPAGCNKTGAQCTSGLVFLDDNTGTDGSGYCPHYSLNNPNATNGLQNLVNLVAGYGKFINLIVSPASYNNNTVSPGANTTDSLGIFGQHWADFLDTDCSGVRGSNGGIYSLTRASSHRYMQGDYVYDAGTTAYWQMQNTCGTFNYSPSGSTTFAYSQGSSGTILTVPSTTGLSIGSVIHVSTNLKKLNGTFITVTGVTPTTISYSSITGPTTSGNAAGDITQDAACVSSSGANPISGAGPVTDGTVVWTKLGAHAPFLDSWVGSAYNGLANKAYALALSLAANAQGPCNGTTCTVTLNNPYVGQNGDIVLISNGLGDLSCNTGSCTITGIAGNQVTYHDTAHSTCIVSCTVAGGSLSAQRPLNMGMTNATIQVVQSGLPNPLEAQEKVFQEGACKFILDQLANNPNVGYVRCGWVSGEWTTTGLTFSGNQGWKWGSEPNAIAAVNWYANNLGTWAFADNIAGVGNMNSFDMPEAQLSILNNIGIGTNGYQVNDVLQILAGNALVVNSIQGDWPLNFSLYCNSPMPNGYYPICELQNGSTLNGGQGTSTPGLDNAGNTGSEAPDPPFAGNSACVSCPFPGLVPIAKLEGANDFEHYDLVDFLLVFGTSPTSDYPAGGSIAAGFCDVDNTGLLVTPHGLTISFASAAGNMLMKINGVAGYGISVVTDSSHLTLKSPGTGGLLANVSCSYYADPALYSLAYGAAYASFINLGATLGNTLSGGFSTGTRSTAGAGVGYTAPTSLATITYPSTPPSVGRSIGAGTLFTDPTWGATGVRLTDATFDPSLAGTANNSYVVSNGGSDDDILFSTGDFLTFVKSTAGVSYLEGFNPSTFALSRPYSGVTTGNCPLHSGNCSTTGGWATGDSVAFSLTDPCKAYTLANSGSPAINAYTFGSDVVPWTNPCSSSISGPPAPVPVVSFVENSPPGCTGATCNCLPADFGAPTWAGNGETTTGDSIYSAGFSSSAYHFGSSTGQNSGFYAVIYSPVKGCMSYNTQTGAIQADVGWAGGSGLSCTATQCSGTATLTSRFTLHAVRMNKTGTRFAVGSATCISGVCPSSNPFIWVVGTTTVYDPGATTSAGGHWALGSQAYIDRPGTPLYQYYQRTLPSNGPPSTKTPINGLPSPPCATQVDQHEGYVMADANDTVPFAFAETTASILTGGLLPFDALPCAWIAEIDMADMNGDGLVHREALTYNTGWSWQFDAANSIIACSPSGKFCSGGSDWLNTLGNVAGNSLSCIPVGPRWQASKPYPSQYYITPVSANNPGGFSYSVASSCLAGTVQPSTWNQTVGGTQTDGSGLTMCTWTNLGKATGSVNACHTDAFLWKLY